VTRERRRAGAGIVLLVIFVAVFAASWITTHGQCPCGLQVFGP
jgi:hypothetical protein